MSADYKRFLASAPTEEVLAYFGGPYVESATRRFTVRPVPPAPGFWRFSLAGRTAEAQGPAEPPDLSDRPAERGYVIVRPGDAVYLALESGSAERLAIGPPDEPMPFAPVLARRFPKRELVFDSVEFESGVEDAVREAYERRGTLADVRGAPAALRAAFGYAVMQRVAQEETTRVRPVEARPHLAALADRGESAARELLVRLRQERARVRAPAADPEPEPVVVDEPPQWTADRRNRRRPDQGTITDRAADALYAAGAAMRNLRRLEGDRLEVRYDLDGERFVTIVDSRTLNVLDAGICLERHDRELTLESLPSVIREAIRTGALYVTAH